jgi:RNA polymerase sigma-70 factor (ECF subfamily)
VEEIKYHLDITRYIVSRIKNPSDAEDLAQRVFLEFYRNNDAFDNVQNPKAYLFGIARKLISHYYRQKNKESGFLQVDSEITYKIGHSNHRRGPKTEELVEEIANIISQLPPKAREAVRLRLIDNLSYEEAAKNANCSVGVLYDRFHEGLKIVRKKIQTQLLQSKGVM